MAGKQTSSGSAQSKASSGSRRFLRYCFVLLLLGAVAIAWLSLVSFSPTDPPSPYVYPPKRPVDNAAGLVGAYTAYALRYYLGAGVYMGLIFATVAAGILVFGGRVRDLPWRALGLALVMTAGSAALYVRDPGASADVFNGHAGVLGIEVGGFLLTRFAGVGAWIILAVAFCIGVMLAADNLVLQLPRLGRKAWGRRGDLPKVAGMFSLRGPRLATATGGAGVAARPIAGSPAVRAPAPRVAPSRPGAEARPAAPSRPVAPDRTTAAPQASPADRTATPSPQPRPAQAESPARPAAPKAEAGPAEADRDRAQADRNYKLPSSQLLKEPTDGYIESQQATAELKRAILQQTLSDFNVAAEVLGYMTGPVITLYEVALAPGVKVAQIANLAQDIARALAVPGVRIVSPIPGKDTMGIEVPNLEKEIVRIRELMNMAPQAEKKMVLPLYLGKDASGSAIVADLASMPHMLIAGTTGSGKSVCINAIIMSLLMTRTPEDVRLILVDPKMVEMAAFETIPHLLCPIVNDMRRAEDILEWAATKMDERYELLKEANVKNIAGYNALGTQERYERFQAQTEEDRAHIPLRLPYYVIIIDELADLIMTADKEVEGHIIRIAQKARAVGIHLILATQRPSVNVVTGLIKANMPCRISFRVSSRQESRIVLDQNGADVLLGRGDMLFLQPGTSDLVRAQGAYVDDAEIKVIVAQLRKDGSPQFHAELMRLQSPSGGENAGERDEMFDKAVEIILQTQRGSVSLLQRRLQVGYSRASRIIDQMADAGILGDFKGSQAREVMMTLEDWHALKASIAADQSGESSADGEPTSA